MDSQETRYVVAMLQHYVDNDYEPDNPMPATPVQDGTVTQDICA